MEPVIASSSVFTDTATSGLRGTAGRRIEQAAGTKRTLVPLPAYFGKLLEGGVTL